MDLKYYLQNLLIGFVLSACFIFIWFNDKEWIYLISFFSIISAFLFPFSRRFLEMIALSFTKKEFWSKGIFVDTAPKSGLYALYYIFVFVFSLLFSVFYFVNVYIIGSREND